MVLESVNVMKAGMERAIHRHICASETHASEACFTDQRMHGRRAEGAAPQQACNSNACTLSFITPPNQYIITHPRIGAMCSGCITSRSCSAAGAPTMNGE